MQLALLSHKNLFNGIATLMLCFHFDVLTLQRAKYTAANVCFGS